ncbi:hypothetical protein [Candidatus Chlorohelix sp.]|uniref:hypothetical protein n=1 Tax=Candidatus Chlorohelix sp. TaxID=3139201 RepID=UPI00303B3380
MDLLSSFIAFGVFALLAISIYMVFYGRLGLRYPLGNRHSAFARYYVNKQEAEQRAEQLLKTLLPSEQYNHLVRKGYLEVQSGMYPYRTYRIPRHRGSVEVYEMGRLVMSLCVQPTEVIPDADVVVMHKLMIEGNEREYLRRANYFDRQTDPFW